MAFHVPDVSMATGHYYYYYFSWQKLTNEMKNRRFPERCILHLSASGVQLPLGCPLPIHPFHKSYNAAVGNTAT